MSAGYLPCGQILYAGSWLTCATVTIKGIYFRCSRCPCPHFGVNYDVLKSFLDGFCYDHQPGGGGKFEYVNIVDGKITLDVQVTVSNR